MGQISWMFNLIPDVILNWIYWAIIAIGLTCMFAGWFSKFIPVYGRYIEYIKPVGIALVILGVWLRGGYDTEMAWRDKVKELQVVYQDRIKEIEKRIDAECKVAPEAIGILNDAAKLRKGTVTIEEVKK